MGIFGLQIIPKWDYNLLSKDGVNLKTLYHELEKFIIDCEKNDILFFGVTINTSWEYSVNSNKENILNNNVYLNSVSEKLVLLLKKIELIPLISFSYIGVELNTNNVIHFHVVLGLRDMKGFDDLIQKNLFIYLSSNLKDPTFDDFTDVKVDKLKTEKDRRNFFQYCMKNIGLYIQNLNNPIEMNDETLYNSLSDREKIYSSYKKLVHKFCIYYEPIYSSATDITEYCSLHISDVDLNDLRNCERIKLDFIYDIKKKYEYIHGCPEKEKSYNEYTLINLINFYLVWKNYYICNGVVYEKIPFTRFSIQKVDTLFNLINNFEEIYISLRKEFFINLDGLDIYTLKIKYLLKLNEFLKKFDKMFLKVITIDFNILEFGKSDKGIFLLSFNKYIPEKYLIDNDISLETTNKASIKYYDKTFKNLSDPSCWIEQLSKTLKNLNQLDIFCIYFGSLFALETNYLGKKRVPYIHGIANSGKTFLTTKVLINFFGLDSIGYVTKNKSFALENIIDKKIAVFDEFEHVKLPYDDLLKLLEGSPLAIDQKHQFSKIQQAIKLILISNNKIKIEDPLVEEALNSRIQYIEFSGKLIDDTEGYARIAKSLIDEEVNIIIYCVKKYFSECVYKQTKQPKMKNDNFYAYFFPKRKLGKKSNKNKQIN